MKLCIAPVRAGDTASAMLARPTRFDCTTPHHQFGPGDFWAVTATTGFPKSDDHARSVARFASLWQDRVTLYALYADGRILDFTFNGTGASRHLRIGAMIEQDLPERAVPVVRLLWRVDGSANIRGIVNRAALETPNTAITNDILATVVYAGFAGLCLALLVYNFALWVTLRHRFQLAYCAMIVSLLVYAFSSSGLFAYAFPDIANNHRIRINYAMLSVCGASALLFARYFFEDRVFDGWLKRASYAVVAVLLATGAAFVILAPWHIAQLDLMFSIAFVAELVMVVCVLWRAWRQRSDFLWVFAIGWATPVIFACLRTANSFHLIGSGFWLDNSTLIAMSLEALLSSVAIAYRVHLLCRERDDSRLRELAAQLLADTDPLTGLRNRRSFLQAIGTRAGDQQLMIADVDHFKQINETIGHDGGDDVLRAVASALRTACPADALIARIGGEEFAIVVAAGAPVTPNAVLETLRREPMPYDLTVTASIGHCTGPLDTESDWKRMYRCADKALFAAKAAGRDRVRGHVTMSRVA
ncbi:sensor domain-containing diguanylate cyclase [Sphingomonas sp. Leaf17]|uniref:sensor domain-containing diguanylate cyclase n=1 Tax=Sphingomonas sp. Leaf17 TaxID=1735683 RepID=UPI00138EC979|nr:diguanylate cyclase [Sphingomonas sp. Leaf17]